MKNKKTSFNKRQNIRQRGKYVGDAFVNPATKTGQWAGNLSSFGGYVFNPITRNRIELEAAYRGSWVVGRVIDSIAEDMTREGITLQGIEATEKGELDSALSSMGVMESLCTTIKWGRLYGGAIGVLLIDGEDVEQPLNFETIRPHSFRGIFPVDRWCCDPDLTEYVDILGRELGHPKYYRMLENFPLFSGKRVHFSRVIRCVGVELPFYQRQWERGWGISLVERIFDVLRAFDSATLGASQLVYQARLWVLGIKGLRTVLGSTSDAAQRGLLRQLDNIRQWRQNEGLSLIDADDRVDQFTYSFSGLDDILQQFIQQISGASGIPITRLMGQSPKGFSSGEQEIRQYYDVIKQHQEYTLRVGLTKLLHVAYRSLFYKQPDENFGFEFNSLWVPDKKEEAEILSMTTDAVINAYNNGIISEKIALSELQKCGMNNISGEDIEQADNQPPDINETDTTPEQEE